MRYDVHVPGPPLFALVDYLWALSDVPAHARERIVPSGTQELVINLHEDVLYVDDIESTITALKSARAQFRNEIEVGPGGKQILLEDPDGNPIELHEAPRA